MSALASAGVAELNSSQIDGSFEFPVGQLGGATYYHLSQLPSLVYVAVPDLGACEGSYLDLLSLRILVAMLSFSLLHWSHATPYSKGWHKPTNSSYAKETISSPVLILMLRSRPPFLTDIANHFLSISEMMDCLNITGRRLTVIEFSILSRAFFSKGILRRKSCHCNCTQWTMAEYAKWDSSSAISVRQSIVSINSAHLLSVCGN